MLTGHNAQPGYEDNIITLRHVTLFFWRFNLRFFSFFLEWLLESYGRTCHIRVVIVQVRVTLFSRALWDLEKKIFESHLCNVLVFKCHSHVDTLKYA